MSDLTFKCSNYFETRFCISYLNNKGYYFQNKQINKQVKSILIHKDVRNIFIFMNTWSRDGITYKHIEWSGSNQPNNKLIILNEFKPFIKNYFRKQKIKNIL